MHKLFFFFLQWRFFFFFQGQECTVKTVRDEAIVCATPAYEWSNMTVYPGEILLNHCYCIPVAVFI